MRVGIDGRALRMPGIGRYTEQLIRSLAEIDMELVVFVSEPCAIAVPDHRVTFVTVPIKPFSVVEQLQWPKIIKEHRLDLFHAPTYDFPIFSPVPVVVTLHDLVYLRYPHFLPSLPKRLYYRLMHWVAVRRAKVITGSQFAAREIQQALGLPTSRIDVFYHAVDPRYTPVTDPRIRQEVLSRYDLPADFFLYVGTLKEHKNPELLARAYKTFQEESHSDTKLVLVGLGRAKNERSYALLFGANESVVRAPFVADDDLPVVYGAARAVIVPSLYEGFGLAALEGMACGAPVVVADAASLPEVVGDAAFVVSPHDPEELARTMALIDSASPAEVLQWRERGRERSQHFQWRAFRDTHYSTYTSILNAHPSQGG